VRGAQLSSRENAGGRYVAASRDGEIRFFNIQLDLLLSFQVERPSQAAAAVSVWVTDVVCMLNVGVLAVACTPGFIAFYSAIATGIVHPIVIIDKLEICPSTVDYWSVARLASSCSQLWRRPPECKTRMAIIATLLRVPKSEATETRFRSFPVI